MIRSNHTAMRSLTPLAASPADLSGRAFPARWSVGARLGASRRRKRFAALAAVLFSAALAIGIWGAYRVTPSWALAFAVTCVMYVLLLTAVFFIREEAETLPTRKTAQSGGHGTVDNWLGLGVGDIGRVRPGSIDAEIHLELGTLSPAHLTERDDLPLPGKSEYRQTDREPHLHAGEPSNA